MYVQTIESINHESIGDAFFDVTTQTQVPFDLWLFVESFIIILQSSATAPLVQIGLPESTGALCHVPKK